MTLLGVQNKQHVALAEHLLT